MSRYFLLFLSLIWMIVGTTQCSTTRGETKNPDHIVPQDLLIKYDLKAPVEKYLLPYVLTEISGLTLTPANTLLCVQDEKGKVFEYDLKKRAILQTTKFAGSGDYEGIELVGDRVYVLRSDGDLYTFKHSAETPHVKTIETPLTRANNTEGLGIDPVTGHLLIACKEDAGFAQVQAEGKAIYAFDTQKEALIKTPAYVITKERLADFVKQEKGISPKKKSLHFKPSGVAVNPADGLTYVLASSGKLLIALTNRGVIRSVYKVPASQLIQPEGICFSNTGVMYISSEGQGEKGYILQFSPITQ